MSAGRFGHASQLFHRAVAALPPQTPLSKRARMVCLEMQCNFSRVEQASVSNIELELELVLDAVSRLLDGLGEFALSDIPPDVAAKAEEIRIQARVREEMEAVIHAFVPGAREPAVVQEPDDFLADHEQIVRSQSIQSQSSGAAGGASARQRRRAQANRRLRTNRSRTGTALGGAGGAGVEAEEEMQGDHYIQTCEVLASNVEGLACNAGLKDDRCPCCLNSWGEFDDSSTLCVVLPCQHAVCLPCLSQRWKVCRSSDVDAPPPFACGLCRGLLPLALVPNIAAEVLEQHSADSGLTSLVNRLSMKERAQKALVESLLVLVHFDFSQVLAKLMDMVGYLGHELPDLSAEEKREIIRKAREHEWYLREQLREVKAQLQELDGQSPEGRALRERLNLLYEQVRAEAARAADDIFERINGVGSMATETQEQCMQLDLHGQYKVDAKQKVEEIVLPVLSVVGRIVLITGRGLHSSRAEGDEVHSVLMQAVMEYLLEKGLGVEPVPGNDGAVFALSRTS
jgi:hypothetical protein